MGTDGAGDRRPTVVDIDSHFMEPLDWIDQSFPSLAERLPPLNLAEMVAWSVLPGDDVISHLPPKMRPAPLDVVPSYLKPVLAELCANNHSATEFAAALKDDRRPEVSKLGDLFRTQGAYDPVERTAFIDARGIDYQFLLPSAPGHDPFVRATRTGDRQLARDCLSAWNSWAAEVLSGYTDRLMPVTLADLSDVDSTVRELTRMRDAGSRCFNVRAEPAGGKSLAHPDYEVVWATAADLGMAVMFHTGSGRPQVHPDWANDGSGATFNYLALCSGQAHQVPELAIGSLILGGVLERHPELVILACEFGISWLPHWLEKLDELGFGLSTDFRPEGMTELPMRPSEYVSRQVFVTPLPAQRLHPTMDALQGIIHFATDYPHPEGSEGAIEIFDDQLDGLGPDERARFYGSAVADALALASR